MNKYDTQEHPIQFITAILAGILIFIVFLFPASYIWITYTNSTTYPLFVFINVILTGIIGVISIHIYYALINSKLKQIEVEKEFYKKYGKIPNIEEALDFYKEHEKLIKDK